MKTIPDETVTRIRDHLKTLKLTGMEKALEKELSEAAKKGSAPMDLLERLLSIEANALIERRIERRIRESKLPDRKLLADFDFIGAVFLEDDDVADLDRHGGADAVLQKLARTDGDDLALFRFFLVRGLRQNDAARRLFLGHGLDDDMII